MSIELNKTGGANRYRFQTFSERVKSIKIDPIHKVVHNNVGIHTTSSENVECFFIEGLAHWKDMNCTAEYSAFRRDVYKYSQSFEQILYHQKEICELILQYLDKDRAGGAEKAAMAAEPLLNLVTLLARDLQEEFFPYFPAILKAILSIIPKNDAKMLESIFNSVAYLFKYLSKQVTEDILPTYQIFQVVLEDHRPYIRQFGAEAFGFLIRKVPHEKLTALFKYITKSLHENPSEAYSEGVALLLFETLKQVRNTLHSRAITILRLATSTILSLCPSPNDIAFETLLKTIYAVGHHITPETGEELWNFLIDATTAALPVANNSNADDPEKFRKSFQMLSALVLLRRGSRIADRARVFAVVDACVVAVLHRDGARDDALAVPVVECLASLVAFSDLGDVLVAGKAVLANLFASNNAFYIFSFCSILQKLKSENLAKIVMPQLMSFLHQSWNSNIDLSMMFFAELVQSNFESNLQFVSHDLKTSDLCLKLPNPLIKKYLTSLDSALDVAKLDWNIEIDNLVSENLTLQSRLASIFLVLSTAQLISTPFRDLFAKIKKLVKTLLFAANEVQGTCTTKFGTISRRACVSLIVQKAVATLSSRTVRAGEAGLLSELCEMIVGDYLTAFATDVQCLEAVADYIDCCASELKVTDAIFEKTVALLVSNTGSVDSTARLCSLRIITSLAARAPGQHDVQIFQIALDCEQIENSLEKYREKSILIKKMDNMIQAKLVNKINEEAAIRYCLALMSSRFSMIHQDATALLTTLAKQAADLFWKYYFPLLVKTKNQEHNVADFKLDFPPIKVTVDVEKKGVTTICTAANKVHAISEKTCSKFGNLKEFERRAMFESTKDSIDRLDDQHYYLQLIKLLRVLPNIVEQKSEQILPFYFELLHRNTSAEDEDSGEKEVALVLSADQIESSSIRGIVIEFLHVFENLHKPQSVSEPKRLYESFQELLSNGDAKIQLLALNCVLTWKEPGVVQYAENLKGLTDDSKFRDFLSNINVEELRNSVEKAHQQALLRVLLRILYGKLISRRGRGSSKVGLKARRNAIFAFLVSLDDGDREFLVDLMLVPFDAVFKYNSIDMNGRFDFVPEIVGMGSVWPLKFQAGFLNILEDTVRQLKNYITPMLPKIMSVVLYLMNAAELELVKNDGVPDDVMNAVRLKQLKDVRHLCMLRLAQLFNSVENFDFGPYVRAIYTSIIDSRIPKFDSENTQSSSALMEIIVAWSKKRSFALYLNERPELLPKVLGVLSAKNVQESVTSIVVGVFESFLAMDEEAETNEVCISLIKPNIVYVLLHFGALLAKLLQQSLQKFSTVSLVSRIIRVLAQTSGLVNTPVEAENLVVILIPCLRKSSQAVSEQLKVDILQILANFIPMLPSLQDSVTRMEAPYFVAISQMFSALTERASRVKAIEALRQFSLLETKLEPVVVLIEKLNAYSTQRIEEPDFNVRFDAFSEIGQNAFKSMDADQWLPILHSLVFSLQDQTEFSIRTSAAFCLSKFIEIASGKVQAESHISEHDVVKMKNQVVHVLFPAVKKGVKSNVELVRSEFMTLLGTIVKSFGDLDQFKDMVVLLVEDDDEANFFSNIYHMQMHRRIKALKRLAETASAGSLSQSNVSNIFLPLVTHVIFEANRQADHNIMNEAISTIAACSSCLSWGKYYALIKNFMKAIKKRPALEKELIRVVVAILENFKFKMGSESEVAAVVPTETDETEPSELDVDTKNLDAESDDGDDDEMDVDEAKVQEPENVEQMQRIHNTVCKKLIPDLFSYLTKEDDENVNLRVPVAVAITKLLTKLPEESMNIELPRLLTTVCQFLKNRLQDVRDGCRDALLKIAKELGPVYFPFIVKELQGALLRGYQLHVLGYSVHHLLVGVSETFGDYGFDDSIDMLVRIFVNDIFGEISDEREVEEMHGKLKEMKRTKSFDSFELVSKGVRFDKIMSMLLPLKEIMLESSSAKTVNKIQDILRKMVSGLNTNSGLTESNLLVFVHGLITESLPLSKLELTPRQKRTAAEKRITVQMKRNEPLNDMLTYFKANAFLFVDFGLSLLLVLIKKDGVRPNNEEHLKMMDPLVEILSKSLYSTHNSVVVNALKIFTYLVKWPLPSLEVSLPAVLNRIFDMFTKKGDVSEEKSDSSLKLLGALIKDCPYVDITQKQIITLITVLTPELEEPDRQGAAFALIRSILNRKYVFAEIYDMMAVVSKLMVTSQSNHVRDLCRQSHCQFILEYPHGPRRLKKEFAYLIQNLKYEFESGRESILAFFGLIIPKVADEVLGEFAEMLLLSFVMVLVNDDSSKCREKSSDLIKQLIRHSNGAKRETFVNLIIQWFQQTDQPQLLRTAAQVVGLYIDAVSEKDAKSVIDKMIPQLLSTLNLTRDEFEKAAYSEEEEKSDCPDDEMKLQYWRAGYYSLNTISKIFAKSKQVTPLSSNMLELWGFLKYLLLYPHTWIRSIACRLFGVFFAAINLDNVDQANLTFRTVILDSREISFISMQLTKQLESTLLNEDLAKQVVKNLLFLGKCMMRFHSDATEADKGNDNDGESAAGNVLLVKIFKRMSYIARADLGTNKVLLRKTVFQWFGAMVLSMKTDDYTPYITPAISVLYRTINSQEQEPEELKLIGKEIAEHIQNCVGLSKYLEMYNKIHAQVTDTREERKTKRKIQAIVDPESSAKRREQKSAMKKAGKKRKAEEFSKSRIRIGLAKRARKGIDA